MIGPAIAHHLEKNGFTKYRLAALWIVSRSRVTELCKRDSNPKWITIVKVADALGITVSEIVKTAESMKIEETKKGKKIYG